MSGRGTPGAAERADYGDLTAEQGAALDRAAAAHGVSVVQLMEVAGWQVARWVFAILGGTPAAVLVVAGHGNNGGDGLVAARHLRTWGFPVEVALIAEPDRLGPLPSGQLAAARAAGAALTPVPAGDIGIDAIARASVVLDAILGTGLRGDPRPHQAEAISRLPRGRTLAIDIPSGLDATTGTPGAPTVRAARTCTLTAMKAGLWTAAGQAHAGEVTVADIGMPAAAWAASGLVAPRLVRGGQLLSLPTDTR
jgi:NAD(P)H-hydrate epimerase